MDILEPSTVLTRQELYDLVWSTPLSELADRFGTTTIDLATACAGWRIPLPDRAWWCAKRDGAEGIRRPLPCGAIPTQKINIHARDPRRWLSSDELTEYVSRLADEATERYRMIVPSQGEGTPHLPLAMEKQLRPRKLKELEQRIVRSLIRVRSTDGLSRALRILTAVGDAFHQRGYVVAASDTNAVKVVVWGVPIRFRILEAHAPQPHVTAEIDKAPLVKRAASDAESIPSGNLELIIDEEIENERRTFSDSPRRPLESCLNNFFVSLLRIAMRRRAERNRAAEIKRQEVDRQS